MKPLRTCPKCYSVLMDGDAFCPECGASTAASPPPGVPAPMPTQAANPSPQPVATAYRTIFCPDCGAKTTTESSICPACHSSIVPAGAKESFLSSDAAGGGKKRAPLKIRPIFLCAAAAVVILVVLLAVFLGGGSSQTYLLYGKDKELHYTKPSGGESIQLTTRLFGTDIPYASENFSGIQPYVLTSNDGRYIFYPDRLNGPGATYFWRDLNADNTQSDAAVRIDSDIRTTPKLNSSGSKLFYIKGDDSRLYVYDRQSGEKTKLDDNVVYISYNSYNVDSSWFVNDAGDYLVYEKHVDDEYSIYEITLKGGDFERKKVDSNSRISSISVNDKKMCYMKESTLYYKEYQKDREKAASGVDAVFGVSNGSSLYYTKTDAAISSLMDYVNDDLASSDSSLTEPSRPTYPDAPVKPRESDYPVTETWVPFDWGDLLDGYDPAEWEDMKAILVAGGTVEAVYDDEKEEWGNWEYSSQAFNDASAKYLKDKEAWDATCERLDDVYTKSYADFLMKEWRDDMRGELKSPDNAVSIDTRTLYHWEGGEETLVAEDLGSILGYSRESLVILYQKYEAIESDKINLSDLLTGSTSTSSTRRVAQDLKEEVENARSLSDTVYAVAGGTETAIEAADAMYWRISESGTIYFLDNYDSDTKTGALVSATVDKEGLSGYEKIDEDVNRYFIGGDRVYYGKDVDSNDSGELYTDGSLIASDVYLPSLFGYGGTGSILLFYTDYSVSTGRGTLIQYKDGNEIKIADDVSYFMPIDERNVAFITDYSVSREKGDLMLYNGGAKPSMLDTDVTALITTQSYLGGFAGW